MKCNWCQRHLLESHVGAKYCSDLCKQKTQNRARNRREQDPRRAAEGCRAWRRAHVEQAKAQSREQGLKWRRTHPAEANAATRRWQKRNPEAARAIHLRHVARKAGAKGSCSTQQLQARVDFYGGRCWVPGCGKQYEAIDHVIPLAKGGSNWPANLRPICAHHNSSKGARHYTTILERG